jgi:glycosyltransferase involved in cell wall biosynthesis
MATIALCMIVKNESHVIERCLNSVKSIIDAAFIQDTGSVDNTMEIVNKWLVLNNITGFVYRTDWINFAANRTLALQIMIGRGYDYAFVIDADDTCSNLEQFDIISFKNNLAYDIYDMEYHHDNYLYYLPKLIKIDKGFRYKSPTHEYIDMPSDATRGFIEGFHINVGNDSSRRKSGKKFEEDIELLRMALKTEKDSFIIERCTFYLAQSLKDNGQKGEAIIKYLERASLNGWNEEIYISLYMAANLMIECNWQPSIIISTYLRAISLVPYRAEALYRLSYYFKFLQKINLAKEFIDKAISIKKPKSGLFIDNWIYDIGIPLIASEINKGE